MPMSRGKMQQLVTSVDRKLIQMIENHNDKLQLTSTIVFHIDLRKVCSLLKSPENTPENTRNSLRDETKKRIIGTDRTTHIGTDFRQKIKLSYLS
jgi:hypothetical protein